MPCLSHAIRTNDIDQVRALLDANVHVDARNEMRETPLMIAVQEGHIKIVEMLLARGARLDACDYFGQTVFTFANANPCAEIDSALLRVHDAARVVEKVAA